MGGRVGESSEEPREQGATETRALEGKGRPEGGTGQVAGWVATLERRRESEIGAAEGPPCFPPRPFSAPPALPTSDSARAPLLGSPQSPPSLTEAAEPAA